MTSWTVGSAASLSRPPNGVCAILFGDDDNTLIADLATRYPEANRESAEAGSDFRRWVERTLALIDLPTSAPALPLDVAGTAFQETVWRALQEIPPGRTDTYSEVAERIGKPDASRAVAGACAANPAAVAIPCHRVVRSANGRQLDLCPTGSSKSPRVPDTSSRSADVIQVRGVEQTRATDCIAAEEPLEVRLHGRSFAVIMRTPGADRELAAGFLFAERVIRVADDLGTIKYCADPAAEHPENVVNVTLVGGSLATVERMLSDRRQVTTNSSCGLCGRLSIESLRTEGAPLDASWSIDRAVVCSLPDRLRAAQRTFDTTGGLHAAGLFTADGRLDDLAEDVGRHNAVDKVIGRMLMREALPLSDRVLFVSGRTSFEIAQKAFLAGIPVLASVSAPSTLAIDLAADTGITLVGFVRGDNFNVYAHPRRVEMGTA